MVCFGCPENLKIIFFRVVYLNTVYGCLGGWYQFDGSPEICNLSGKDAVFLVTAASPKRANVPSLLKVMAGPGAEIPYIGPSVMFFLRSAISPGKEVSSLIIVASPKDGKRSIVREGDRGLII